MKKTVKKRVDKITHGGGSVDQTSSDTKKASGASQDICEVSEEGVLFARLRQASRAMTNLYNSFMPDVCIASRTGPQRTIPVKVTQLVVLQALYDTSWWQEMRIQRVGAASLAKRDKLEEYFNSKKGYVVQVDLARYLKLDCTTVCRNLKALVESGWVDVMRSDINMRETMIVLTESGRQVVAQACASARGASQKLRECLGDELVKRIDEDLQILTAKIEALTFEQK